MASATPVASLRGQNVQASDKYSIRRLWSPSSVAESGRCGDRSLNLQGKKKTLPLSGTSHHLTHFSLCTERSIGTPCQRSQASRLNHLLFEVTAIATPQVAYSFVTKRCPALHTFNRAGRGAGTRRATKSQLSRCSYLSENASIREERFRNPAYPFVAWGS